MTRIAFLVALILMATAWGCGTRQPASPSSAAEVGPDGLSGSVTGDVRDVRITASGQGFKPSKVYVRKGEEVRLLVTSTDVAHSLVIEKLKIDAKLEPKKTTIVDFTPGAWGDYPFYSTGDKNMSGTLVVVP